MLAINLEMHLCNKVLAKKIVCYICVRKHHYIHLCICYFYMASELRSLQLFNDISQSVSEKKLLA